MPEPAAVNSMFSRIARRYDLANRLISGGIDLWWRRVLVREVRACRPRDVLDLATGSGDVAFALRRALPKETRITGMDFCQPMLDEAELKKQGHADYGAIVFQQGDGMNLPVGDATIDALTISFGLRNMGDRLQCIREMHRVLRPGGRVFVLEFSQPWAWLRPFYWFYLRRILPPIAGAITRDRAAYQYLNDTIEQFPGAPALADEIRACGFASCTYRRLTGGIVALHEAVK